MSYTVPYTGREDPDYQAADRFERGLGDGLTNLLKKRGIEQPKSGGPNLTAYLRARRDAALGIMGELEKRADGATASAARDVRASLADGREYVARLDQAIEEREEQEEREEAAARHRLELGITEPEVLAYTSEERGGVYRDPHKDPTSPSFFRDLADAKRGDWAAAERLDRNHKAAVARETRAGDMTTVAAAGGTFAPPAWLVEEFVALARPGRVTADRCHREALPSGVSSINLPKVASGAAVGVQATQNSALTDTAMTTTSVSSGITTIGGKQIVSLQLLTQSGAPFDRVILGDLAADYAKQLDNQVLYGSNATGQLNGLVNGAQNTAFTTTQPALVSTTSANSFYGKVIAASTGIATGRFMPAEAVVMHPTRWGWCLEALDGEVRPIIATGGSAVNAPAISTASAAEGAVGELAGVPVFLDPNISLTAASSTNQDECYVLRGSDLYLYESPLRLEAFEQTYSDNASVLFRALGWAAFIPNRYAASVASIRGTGMVTPTL
jgi:HK97 family phage major capsid protein